MNTFEQVPSDEEIKKGENMMYESQKKASSRREIILNKWKEIGQNGYLEADSHVNQIEGTVNGIKISISRKFRGREPYFEGTLDDEKITSKQAEDLFRKYCELAYSRKTEKEAASAPSVDDLFKELKG